ncbi:MAG TPA: hypothetical protein GX503_01975 [Clostridiales bacterium]|nr:hypothetical protein [Clostridiales bacterium]
MKLFIGILGTSLSILYLFFRIRYLAKHQFKGFRERMLQNIIDFILVGFIFILSAFQLQGSLTLPPEERPSYGLHILILFAIYLIWMQVNVRHYRKRLQKK